MRRDSSMASAADSSTSTGKLRRQALDGERRSRRLADRAPRRTAARPRGTLLASAGASVTCTATFAPAAPCCRGRRLRRRRLRRLLAIERQQLLLDDVANLAAADSSASMRWKRSRAAGRFAAAHRGERAVEQRLGIVRLELQRAFEQLARGAARICSKSCASSASAMPMMASAFCPLARRSARW